MLLGLRMTVMAALAAISLAILLGLLGASAKLSQWRFLRGVAEAYTVSIRGVPEYVLLLLVFFGTSTFIQKVAMQFGYDEYIELPPFPAGVFAIGFVYGAFTTEVF